LVLAIKNQRSKKFITVKKQDIVFARTFQGKIAKQTANLSLNAIQNIKKILQSNGANISSTMGWQAE
jgi:hypothetical protein